MKVSFSDFIKKYVSGYIKVIIQVNKWDYLKNPHKDKKNIYGYGSYECKPTLLCEVTINSIGKCFGFFSTRICV